MQSLLEDIHLFLTQNEKLLNYIYDPDMTEEDLMETFNIAEENTKNIKSLIGYIPYKYIIITKYDIKIKTHLGNNTTIYVMYWMRYQLDGTKRTCKMSSKLIDMNEIGCDINKFTQAIDDIPRAEDLCHVEVYNDYYFKSKRMLNEYINNNILFTGGNKK